MSKTNVESIFGSASARTEQLTQYAEKQYRTFSIADYLHIYI